MKQNKIKKILSACAVLAISATASLSIVPFVACAPVEETKNDNEKLISVDGNHSATAISTATGVIQTKNSGKIYYVAPGAPISGSGLSWDEPMDISALLGAGSEYGFGILEPGDTVYVKPGTYNINRIITMPEIVNGTYDNYIRIVNAALEKENSGYEGEENIVTLDFSRQEFSSSSRGIQVYGNYTYWYGIDVCGAGDNGMYIGGDYNTVEYCEFYNNRDTGLQLGRIASMYTQIEDWPSYNLVKNCTSHNNYDNQTFGENADGFAAKLTVGYGNVFDGCIAYRNSDDGWDLYAKTDTGNIGCIIIYNCVAFENGFLEYTQEENNAKFNMPPSYNEPNTNSYLTRDGDGNGFKLGGSVMEGDVEMYNCLSFNNRMHGVTDNSNPGFLKVKGVTSYDNSAYIDDNSNSSTFGQIVKYVASSQDEKIDNHANIDVARQTYSYNSVIDTLSINSNIAVKAKQDAYRGSVTNSVLSLGYNASQSLVVKGSIDADTKNPDGIISTNRVTAYKAEDVFVTLPIVMTENDDERTYEFVCSGLNDLYEEGTSGALKSDRVHVKYRNEEDHSINMHNILAKKVELIDGEKIGSELNKTEWAEYKHFYIEDFVNGDATSENRAKAERAEETLTINTDANAVYQDFEVPVKLNGCTISWSTGNSQLVEVGNEVETSLSGSQYITMLVYRPLDNDDKVTITATISCGEGENRVTIDKSFELTIKCGQPSIGAIKVRNQYGEVIEDGGVYVVDCFDVYREPTVLVENGLDYHGKLLKENQQYTYETTYIYSPTKTAYGVEVKGFTPSKAGVYTVTHTVTLVSDNTQTKSMTYNMFVASTGANVDFLESAIAVNRDGYMITGNLTNATGSIYAVSSAEELNVTPETIKDIPGVESFNFRGDNISYQFKNNNSDSYNVYYALSNANGQITSEVYQAKVEALDIVNYADFMKIAGGGKIGSENPLTTIYRLGNDLDFNGVNWSSGTSGFSGLLNGCGHVIKNVSIAMGKSAGIFSKTEGATIENIVFENITIIASDKQAGIIGSAYGGYYHNIAIRNITVDGKERTGGLIGQIFESPIPTNISQVSLVNDSSNDYIQADQAKRAGGIVAFIQTTSSPTSNVEVNISDCYVIADIFASEQTGGIVGALDNAKAGVYYELNIDRCYFGGTCTTTYSTPRSAGILGYESGALGGFNISRCISVGSLYRDVEGEITKIEVALKSASLIVGGANSTAHNTVTRCMATMEEYDSDFDVYSTIYENFIYAQLAIEPLLTDDKLGLWTFAYDLNNPAFDDPDIDYYLKAPFVEFNHIGLNLD